MVQASELLAALLRLSGVGSLWRVLLGAGVLTLLTAWVSLAPLLRSRFGYRASARSNAWSSRVRLVGNALLAAGVLSLLVAGLGFVADSTGGDRVLPPPVALVGTSVVAELPASPSPTDATPSLPEAVWGTATAAGATPAPPSATGETAATPTPPPRTLTATQTATATRAPTETPAPTAPPAIVEPGIPVRMVIPRLKVDSPVRGAGTRWVDGQLTWETLPHVVAYYRSTGKVGEAGNAVFSGHVTSVDAGNVFRDLYKIRLGDEVRIFTAEGQEFVYVVGSVRLVAPTDVSVMDPTPDATATLITCAGEWIPAERSYSQRLIVAAKLKK